MKDASVSTWSEGPSFLDLTLDDIAVGLDEGTFTVQDLTRDWLARIVEVNDTLHAVIEINPEAITIAESLDAEMKRSGRRGPLFGAGILLKDNISTLESLEATAGSTALLGSRTGRESPVATRLRDAGAVLLGTANMSEWANFRSIVSNSGWSPRGGQCYGAYYPQMDPGGSSSGSAVAVDVGLCLGSIGTETSGSLIYPAELNNVVGIKPTVGLVSRDATVPISSVKDTIGPMAHTVKDAATILGVISGKDPMDPKTAIIPFDRIPDYSKSCASTDLSGLRVGVPRDAIIDSLPPVLETFETSFQTLKSLGAEVVDIELGAVEEFVAMSMDDRLWTMAAELHADLPKYLNTLAHNPHGICSLEHLCEYTRADEREDIEQRDLGLWELALRANVDDEEYKKAQDRDKAFSKRIAIVIEEHRLDAIITPTTSKTLNGFAAYGGLPMVTVPLGFLPEDTEIKWSERNDLVIQAPNRPYGLGIAGPAFSEEVLIKIAFSFESATNIRSLGSRHTSPTKELRDIVVSRK